jgi:uncharacterized membrane protein
MLKPLTRAFFVYMFVRLCVCVCVCVFACLLHGCLHVRCGSVRTCLTSVATVWSLDAHCYI